MWLTSWFTPATVAFGLFFISALFVPGDHPRSLDAASGIALIVAAFTVAPFLWILVTGTSSLVGRPIELVIGPNGVDGWPAPIPGGRRWTRLHRPRIEGLVVVLPFRQGTTSRGWVVIPRRAVTDEQLVQLEELLRDQGFLRGGDGRSITGRLLAPFTDRISRGTAG